MRSFWRCSEAALPTRDDGSLSPKPAQIREDSSSRFRSPVDAVERLERPGLGDVAQEVEELLALVRGGRAAAAPRRRTRRRAASSSGSPTRARADRLRDARGRRGDDRAGVVVGVQLQAERRAQHLLAPRSSGSAHVFAHARQPATVSSSSC